MILLEMSFTHMFPINNFIGIFNPAPFYIKEKDKSICLYSVDDFKVKSRKITLISQLTLLSDYCPGRMI